jgi:hypothetical protein
MKTTTWLDTDPCPACGATLHCTDRCGSTITRDCPACGWTASCDVASQAGGSR